MYLITIFLLFGCSIIAAQDGEGAPCFAPNTVLTDCVNLCRNTCAEPDKEEDCDFDICHRGCDCVDGYVRDDNNICILPEECPELQCNNLNEEYDYCRQDQTCQGYFDGGPLILPLPDTCKPDCKCKLGYVRNSNLACVTPRGCCPDPFSRLRANPNPCPGGTCAFPTFSNCFMAIPPFGCQCRTGYLKVSNTNKTCVPEWWCPVADYPDE